MFISISHLFFDLQWATGTYKDLFHYWRIFVFQIFLNRNMHNSASDVLSWSFKYSGRKHLSSLSSAKKLGETLAVLYFIKNRIWNKKRFNTTILYISHDTVEAGNLSFKTSRLELLMSIILYQDLLT